MTKSIPNISKSHAVQVPKKLFWFIFLNNPDAYEEISARVKPEQFQNTLMRRFFEYFSARIERGEDPLTNTAADFTQDENSKLYQTDVTGQFRGLNR